MPKHIQPTQSSISIQLEGFFVLLENLNLNFTVSDVQKKMIFTTSNNQLEADTQPHAGEKLGYLFTLVANDELNILFPISQVLLTGINSWGF